MLESGGRLGDDRMAATLGYKLPTGAVIHDPILLTDLLRQYLRLAIQVVSMILHLATGVSLMYLFLSME